MGKIVLKYCDVEEKPFGVTVTFPDGTYVNGVREETVHYHVLANRLGYGDDIKRFAVEHDLFHAWVCEYLWDRPSPILVRLAEGRDADPKTALSEELTIQAVQGWVMANQRPIVGGVDWDRLKADANAMLHRFYDDRVSPLDEGMAESEKRTEETKSSLQPDSRYVYCAWCKDNEACAMAGRCLDIDKQPFGIKRPKTINKGHDLTEDAISAYTGGCAGHDLCKCPRCERGRLYQVLSSHLNRNPTEKELDVFALGDRRMDQVKVSHTPMGV